MQTKQFQAESKRLLDLMINSIYTHREIFLRELISNASDAIDKLYYHSLSDGTTGLSRADFAINLVVDKDARTLKITDNGCGMTAEELESNLSDALRLPPADNQLLENFLTRMLREVKRRGLRLTDESKALLNAWMAATKSEELKAAGR